jgi:uncharacterized protein YqiB (DUF1249 family)
MAFLHPVNKSWCLEQLCESNYRKIFKLIPELATVKDSVMGLAPNHTCLYLQVVERGAYTMTVELSHQFYRTPDKQMLPAIRVMLYLDARLAEVLCDHARPSVNRVFKDFSFGQEIVNYKWRLNFFLEKWLDHCLAKNYRFPALPLDTGTTELV